MPIVRCYISLGLSGCKIEDDILIDDDEWNALNEEEKEEYLDGILNDFLSSYIDSGAYLL